MLHGSALNGIQNHNNVKNEYLFKQNYIYLSKIIILGGVRGIEISVWQEMVGMKEINLHYHGVKTIDNIPN